MTYLVVKEVDGVLVEPEWERLEEADVVSHHFFVRKVEPMHDYLVNVVVWQQVVCNENVKQLTLFRVLLNSMNMPKKDCGWAEELNWVNTFHRQGEVGGQTLSKVFLSHYCTISLFQLGKVSRFFSYPISCQGKSSWEKRERQQEREGKKGETFSISISSPIPL